MDFDEKPVRPVAAERDARFQGKVDESDRARCRGGERAVTGMRTPWVDWSNYFGAADATSKSDNLLRNERGIAAALADLEYQRMELINFNVFDNKTFEQYAQSPDGPTLKTWTEMRLPPGHPSFQQVGGDGVQIWRGDLIRHRTLTGICNDMRNPAMGSSGQLFARNVEFETTFPELGLDQFAKNRHGNRLSLLQPDPQVISRKLFTRDQSKGAPAADQGHGASDSADADCPYKKAPFFNVLAAFWIQFMTHDWFSHLDEARQRPFTDHDEFGCASERREWRRAAADAGTGGPARLPQGRQDGGRAAGRHVQSWILQVRRRRCPGTRSAQAFRQDDTQHRDGMVGCVANLRLRRALAATGQARPC